jgi:hypothetical protein
VVLEAADDMVAVLVAEEGAAAVEEAGIEELDEGGEVRIVAVVRGRSEEEEAVGLLGEGLGEVTTAGVLGVVAAELDAVMGLVDDDEIPGGAVEILEDFVLLGEVEGEEAEGEVIEGVGAEDEGAAELLELAPRGDGLEAEAEALAHLAGPLLEERTGGGDDEDPVGAATRDELGHDEAGLNGLAEADAVGEEEARPAHREGAHDRDELVGGDVEAARLDGEQGVRAKGLLEEKCVVIELPAAEARRMERVELVRDRGDRIERAQEVDLFASESAVEAAEAVAKLLRPGRFGVDDLPAETAHQDLGAGEVVGHAVMLRGGPRQRKKN